MAMDKSPWSTYGRITPKSESARQLEQFMTRTLKDFHDIRSRGYGQIIRDAMTPSPGPETVEERLRRLEREAKRRGQLR